MRWILVLLLLTTAQAEPLLTDAAGDQTSQYAGVDNPDDGHQEIDLLSADFVETIDGFDLTMKYAQLERGDGSTGGIIGGEQSAFYFDYEAKSYRVIFYHWSNLDDVQADSYLQQREGADDYSSLEWLPVMMDLEEATLQVSIPRGEIYAADGAPVAKDGVFSNFYAEAIAGGRDDFITRNGGMPVEHGSDRMPDEDVSTEVLTVIHGVKQSGHARLDAEEPFRISNGEATTFLFEVTASNLDDIQDAFTLKTEGVPEGWTITLPVDKLNLDGDETTEVPVLVSMPFNHKHGAVDKFLLEMHSQTDPDAVGRIEIGVRFTEVPQPAGHHNKVFLHSGETYNFFVETPAASPLEFMEAYMNTLEVDELSSDRPIRPVTNLCNTDGTTYGYEFPLRPGLAMGLDFDLDKLGELEVTMQSDLGSIGVVVDGGVFVTPEDVRVNSYDLVWGDASEYMVADIAASDATPMDPGAPHTFTLDITPLEAGDYISYEPGNRMTMILIVEDPLSTGFICFGGGNGPSITSGSMTLPLNEYHDDVDEIFASASGLDLDMDGPRKRLANPGDVMVFEVEANAGTKGTFDLSLNGINPEWAYVVGGERLQASGKQIIPIIVEIPATATDGEVADISLVATHVDDAQLQTVLRFVVEVDEDAEHEDDAELASEYEEKADKQSPGPSVLLLALLLLRRRT